MHTPDPCWQLAATSASSGSHHPRSPWWRQTLIALRPPVWPAAAATLMALGLLLAFQQVVAQAVEQGDLQRRATAAQVEASWRCKLLRGSSDRDNCPAQAGGAKTPILLSHALVKPKEK